MEKYIPLSREEARRRDIILRLMEDDGNIFYDILRVVFRASCQTCALVYSIVRLCCDTPSQSSLIQGMSRGMSSHIMTIQHLMILRLLNRFQNGLNLKCGEMWLKIQKSCAFLQHVVLVSPTSWN